MCLALQPRRGRTKTEKFQEMVKSVELIRVKQKPLSPGGDSPDLCCTSALSINTSNGLLGLVSLCCINQLGSDLIPSAGLNARWNRGEKLQIPGGENIFVIVMQKKKLPFSFPHLTAGDEHKASLAVAVSAMAPWSRWCRAWCSLSCSSPLNHFFTASRMIREKCGAPVLVLLQRRGPACSPASLRLSGTNQQRARH